MTTPGSDIETAPEYLQSVILTRPRTSVITWKVVGKRVSVFERNSVSNSTLPKNVESKTRDCKSNAVQEFKHATNTIF